MHSTLTFRSRSTTGIPTVTLNQIKQAKKSRAAQVSIDKLKQMRVSYEQNFYSHRSELTQNQEEDNELRNSTDIFRGDFQTRSRRTCEQMYFELQVFQKIFKDNHRKKSILVRLYGWDKQFQDIFFLKNRQQLRPDLSPQFFYQKLSLSTKTFQSRNLLNKLRLLLNQLISHNKRQQQLQSRFMKIRLSNQFTKLDKEVNNLKQRKNLRGYIQQIGRTHEMMLNSKIRVKNQQDGLEKIWRNTGKTNVNQFYVREEGNISGVEKMITQLRIGRLG